MNGSRTFFLEAKAEPVEVAVGTVIAELNGHVHHVTQEGIRFD